MQEEYSIYSKFDLNLHKKTYNNYFEVVIHQDGTIEYAVPSHSEKLISIACNKMNVTRQELLDRCPQEYYGDFNIWLSKITGCCAVWLDCVIGFEYSRKQIGVLRKLKINGIYLGCIPEPTV